MDSDGAATLKALAVQLVVGIPRHAPVGLVSHHLPKYSGADRALQPILGSFEHLKAAHVKHVSAGEGYDVIVRLGGQFGYEVI